MSRICVWIGGREYEWVGGLGCVLESRERGIKDNEVRYIAGEFFEAINREYYHLMGFTKGKSVAWTPCREIDAAWIRNFKRKILHCDDPD